MRLYLLFYPLLFLLFFCGCSEDEKYYPPSDPYKAILGRWRLYESNSVYDNFNTIEFYSDGTTSYTGWELQAPASYSFNEKIYQNDDEFNCILRLVDSGNNTEKYFCQFYEDKMSLTPLFVSSAIGSLETIYIRVR